MAERRFVALYARGLMKGDMILSHERAERGEGNFIRLIFLFDKVLLLTGEVYAATTLWSRQ